VQFKTFAYYRIKGAIYDGMRKMGWYPKGLYQQMRFEMAANEYLKDASSEAPQAGTPESQLNHLHDLTGNLLSCYMLSLEAGRMDPADQGQVSAEDTVVLTEQRKHLRLSLMQLPETNRRVVECYYFEQLTFDQIGERLGLSKSWVCRVHAKSLEMLRKLLAPARTSPVANPSATFSEVIR
jgi:RNA polymerase sigma factor for flagellar operon FliA